MQVEINDKLSFTAGGEEVLTITADGQLLIKGEPVESNDETADAFKKFAIAFATQQALQGRTLVRIATLVDLVEQVEEGQREFAALRARTNPLIEINYNVLNDVDPNTMLGVLAQLTQDCHRTIAATQAAQAQAVEASKAKGQATKAPAPKRNPKKNK